MTVSAGGDCADISDSGELQCRNTVHTIHSGALGRQWGVCHKRIVTSCMTHDMKLDILVSSTWSSESIGGFKRYKSACKTDTKLLLNGIITTWVRQIHDSLPHGGESCNRTNPDLADGEDGFWWGNRMPELGFTRADQICKGYKRIPCNPDSAHTLFISPINKSGETTPRKVTMPHGRRVPLNQHLGNLLKEYIVLLMEAMRLHNILINNSTFLLSTARQGPEKMERRLKPK